MYSSVVAKYFKIAMTWVLVGFLFNMGLFIISLFCTSVFGLQACLLSIGIVTFICGIVALTTYHRWRSYYKLFWNDG